MRVLTCLALLGLAPAAAAGGELLRNGDFQDDWLTLLPELKNHHWNYTTEVFNRRDYNPDGWRLSGRWEWRDADLPRGRRRLVLASPSRAVQAVNWVTVNNPAKLAGWPDAGGYPAAEAVRSKAPLALVRDLTFRVRLAGTNVPKGAATLTVAWSAGSPVDDPVGTTRTATASAAVPEGTYADRAVAVTLPAAEWLKAAPKDPVSATQGVLLPMAATVEIAFADKAGGSVEVLRASLSELGPTSPNLLPNGGFEGSDATGYLAGWSRPRKYRYFPPGIYYIFNTWHNANSANRGSAGRDELVPHSGRACLRMTVPTGDEACVVGDPVVLNQKEARLIEVRAWVKTHQLCMLQLDAEDEAGRRLDGFNFIHKNPLSVGTDDWRLVRQVFRPAAPLKSIRVKLCARGMNGYTLGGTGHQPQQNAAGVVWWDDMQVFEPESSAADLKARGVPAAAPVQTAAGPHLEALDLGEQLFGRNDLTADVVNPGPAGTFAVRVEQAGRTSAGQPVAVRSGGRAAIRVPYEITAPGRAYHDEPFAVTLVRVGDGKDEVVATSAVRLATWTVPIDLELGALYLRPGQKQFVRVNLGLTHATAARLKELRFDVLRRSTGQVTTSVVIPATPDAMARRRAKIPDGLRDDFRNLLLADLDVSSLPLQPFDDPQRNWVVRATLVGGDGSTVAAVTSAPFCRLAHDGPQPPVRSVRIDETGAFLVNDRPWVPWGVTYGHNPVYDGPADPGKYHDLADLKPWSLYDRHGGTLADRSLWDANCLRHVEGPAVAPAKLEEMWKKGLYASTVFVPPPAAGKPWPDDFLRYLRTAPMVAAVSRGPEEAFGYFAPMDRKQLAAVEAQAAHLRAATGKPVMVGHGGYWTRLEFEKVPFFDVFDPETEPWYPAPLHTDLAPLVAGKPKAVWLRPQMYESVPYERWRYHVLVELMRGARGWQIAHGPGDASTFRGLHAELRRLQPAVFSREPPPTVSVEPALEHMVRRVGGKTVIIAATTHGLSFGNWRWVAPEAGVGRPRVTAAPHVFRDESDGYHATGEPPSQTLCPHGVQNLIAPRAWPAGSKLVTRVRLDPQAPPRNLVALVKADGRWAQAATWGPFDPAALRGDPRRAYWFLRTFYRHARGFLGWGEKVPPYALDYIPAAAVPLGPLPAAGGWRTLEVPLEKVGAAGKLLDGVGFLHDGGRVWWAQTALVDPAGRETVVFGDHEDRPDPARLGRVRVGVAGLKKGARVKVLFEDRELAAEDGYFVDDFRGTDLYQRYGGERTGYGDSPVAVHVYEIPPG